MCFGLLIYVSREPGITFCALHNSRHYYSSICEPHSMFPRVTALTRRVSYYSLLAKVVEFVNSCAMFQAFSLSTTSSFLRLLSHVMVFCSPSVLVFLFTGIFRVSGLFLKWSHATEHNKYLSYVWTCHKSYILTHFLVLWKDPFA